MLIFYALFTHIYLFLPYVIETKVRSRTTKQTRRKMIETTTCSILDEHPSLDSSNTSPEAITITHSNVKHPQRHLIHWFRKSLRLHDNPAFYEGLKNAATFRCIFTIDPWFAGCSNVGINKWRYSLNEQTIKHTHIAHSAFYI